MATLAMGRANKMPHPQHREQHSGPHRPKVKVTIFSLFYDCTTQAA